MDDDLSDAAEVLAWYEERNAINPSRCTRRNVGGDSGMATVQVVAQVRQPGSVPVLNQMVNSHQ